MKVKYLVDILKMLPYDSDIDFVLQKNIEEERLKNMKYKYPFDLIDIEFAGYDIGYSNKVIQIFLEKSQRQ